MYLVVATLGGAISAFDGSRITIDSSCYSNNTVHTCQPQFILLQDKQLNFAGF